ncbi:MAG: radical SAM protein [Alistipes sp.]|nr:radical SAM protein [Alistipes sp.]
MTRDSLDRLHFTGTVWRPPHEAYSVLLQATTGCTHHACKFCGLYGDLRFRVSPMTEIEADLRIIARWQPRARRVFLVGANPFALGFDRLVRLADRIRDYLPKVQTIGMFSRVDDIARKSDAELRELRTYGFTGLSIGTETGDDPTLRRMNKRTTAAEIIAQSQRLDAAGIEYYFTYMAGLAGAGNGQRAARATAEVFNCTHPYLIGLVSLTVFPDTVLAREVQTGEFREAGELERLDEVRTLLERLEIATTIAGQTVSNTVPLFGRLPEDRARLLRELDDARSRFSERELVRYRRGIDYL